MNDYRDNQRLFAYPLSTILAFVLAIFLAAAFCFAVGAEPKNDKPKQEEWLSIKIPDAWKKSPGGRYAHSDGYGWYVCLATIPAAWKNKDLELFVESADNAHEAYFNGVNIGSAGTFPPEYRSGLGQSNRYPIDAKLVRSDRANLIAMRICNQGSRGGFNVAPPVLFGGESAIQLRGDWRFHGGDDLKWAKLSSGNLDSQEAFDKLVSAASIVTTIKKLDGEIGPLSPQESLKHFKTPDDLSLDLALGEPLARQPLSIKFDERGRMWVLQYLQYPNPAGLKMLSRDKYLRSVYDKVPPPPPHHFPGQDKITIHEDTDGDGVYDKHKTFVDGLNISTSFARGRGGVWVMNPPYLLFYPDKNNDDVPDGDPVVHLEGFGMEDSHSVANSLRWGPDGWLYAAQGSTVTGNIKRTGIDKDGMHSMGQLIWRYHPESRRYEVYAEGGGNAFGVEIDSKGRVYSGHNGGDTRGFHYVQGGYFQKGFGKHGSLSNPYAFGYFAFMAHAKVPRFTHTYVIYEGGALPAGYDGRLFGVSPLFSRLVYSQIEPDRSSFKTRDLGYPLTTDDSWFRPVDIQVGPEGAIYVVDLYEQRIDHASHYQGRVDKTSGRIYRLKAKSAKPGKRFDYASYSTDQLLELLKHNNKWHRQTAIRLLGDRKDRFAAGKIMQMIEQNTGQLALESLWALNLSGGFNEASAIKLLDHNDPYVRLWTVRLLCDEKKVSSVIAASLAALAAKELNVEVRSQLACSAKRLDGPVSLPIVRNLLTHSEDSVDIHLPLLLWWAIEAKAESDRDAVVRLFSEPSLWRLKIVEEHLLERIMRRYAQAGGRKNLLTCAKLLNLAPSKQHSRRLMAGFELAFKGRTLTNLPDELVAALSKAGGVSLALRLRQSEPAAIKEAASIIQNEKAGPLKRVQYIQILGQIRHKPSISLLLKTTKDTKIGQVRTSALSSLQSFNEPQIPHEIVKLIGGFPEDAQGAAYSLLSSRKAWALTFLKAVESGQIKRDDVPMTAVRKILLHPDKKISALVRKQWGEIQGSTTDEMRKQVVQYAQRINTGSGNPYSGKQLFRGSCGKCHTLFSEGGDIGPNLTSYKRSDLHGMLLNVVNPSAEIREGYENFVIFTDDGRTLNGFITEKDNQVVVLRNSEGQSTVIPRDEIDEMSAISRSIMPEGILKTLSDQQIRDLFAYLRATQPLP